MNKERYPGNKVSELKMIATGMVLAFAMMVLAGQNVSAASITDEVPMANNGEERSLVDDVTSASDTVYKVARGSHLNYGYSEIAKLTSTRAAILVTTQAHHVCPEIHTNVYVDQYDPDTGEWNQWRYWEYSSTNASFLSKSMEIIVRSGYYYSVRGYHICIHGDVMESGETVTDGVYIGR